VFCAEDIARFVSISARTRRWHRDGDEAMDALSSDDREHTWCADTLRAIARATVGARGVTR